jgi:hypothetical protein
MIRSAAMSWRLTPDITLIRRQKNLNLVEYITILKGDSPCRDPPFRSRAYLSFRPHLISIVQTGADD